MKIEILLAGKIPSDDILSLEKNFIVHKLIEAENEKVFLEEIWYKIQGLVVTGFWGYDRSLIEALPNLEIVSVWWAGISELDLDIAKQRNITVTVTPDDSKVAVAELGLGLMLASARWIPDNDQSVRSEGWKDNWYSRMGIGLSGRTCGIVGLGTIGKYVAERAQAFGMEILYTGPNEKNNSPYVYQKNLVELAKSSDFLVLCCPNTPETKNIINTEVLNALWTQGNLINIARGAIVDEEALISALQKGTIRSAALDVYSDEPNVPEEIRLSKRTILSAHIGTQIEDVREKRKYFFVKNLEDFFSGRELNEEAVVLSWFN